MTRKTHPATGSYAPANTAISPIEQIRRGPDVPPSGVSHREQRVHLPANGDSGVTGTDITKTNASTVYATNNLHLNQLLSWVRSYSRDRLMKEREVLRIIGRSKAAMRRDVSLGLFPKQIKTGPKSSAWRESEVMGWVEATTILSRVANPGFDMKEFVAALDVAICNTAA